MKLVVGLGNKGKEYDKTRHNVGFIFLDNYLETLKIGTLKEGFKSQYLKKDDVFFQKPMTYMNLSGEAIQEIASYYKIKPQDIYVIYDDIDLPLGKIRIRADGSSGGHNGIKSIIANIGDRFNRIKIGIGPKNKEVVDFVLGKFSKEEFETLENKKKIINSLIEDIINDENIEKLKTKYNNK